MLYIAFQQLIMECCCSFIPAKLCWISFADFDLCFGLYEFLSARIWRVFFFFLSLLLFTISWLWFEKTLVEHCVSTVFCLSVCNFNSNSLCHYKYLKRGEKIPSRDTFSPKFSARPESLCAKVKWDEQWMLELDNLYSWFDVPQTGLD